MRIITNTRATPTMTPYIQKTRPVPRLFLRSRNVFVTRKVPAQLVPVAKEAPRLLDLLGSNSPISSQGIGPNLGEIVRYSGDYPCYSPSGEGNNVDDEGGEGSEGGGGLRLKVGSEDAQADDHAATGDIEKNLSEQELCEFWRNTQTCNFYRPSLSIRLLERTVAKMLTTPRMIVER